MNKLFMIALANIRKTKMQTMTLILLFIISSMLLNIGLMVSLNFNNFYDKTAEELNTSDAYFIIPETLYSQEVEDYIKTHEETVSVEKSTGIIVNANKKWGNDERIHNVLMFDKDETRSVSEWKLVSETLPETENSVYLPYQFKVGGGYNLGDIVSAEIDGKIYEFNITGFVEDIFFSSSDMGVLSFYLPTGRYREITEDLYDYRAVVVFTDVVNSYKNIESGLMELTSASMFGFGDIKNMIISLDLAFVSINRTMMAVLVAAMMAAFSIVIVIVCLLVIRFRIGNSIEEDMPKIGSLMAVGYTSRQIISSVIMQYGVIAVFGSLLGIIPAYISLPWVGDVFALQTGLLWKQGFDPVINLISIGTLVIAVTAVSLIASLKTKKIVPVQALRGGITTHSFKKNYIPLDKSGLPLVVALSFKSLIQNLKQSLMIFFVLTSVAFTAAFAIIMFYNSSINTRTFAEVPGMEISNAILALSPGEDSEIFKKEVLVHKDVHKAQYFDDTNMLVNGNHIRANVMDDYSSKETNIVYDGRYPIYDNEISVSGTFADMIKKGIGDTVLVGEDEKPYIITGLTQGAGSGGLLKIQLTLDGMLKIQPDFKQMSLCVYLNEGINAQAFIDEMLELLGDKIASSADVDKGMEMGMSSYISIVAIVGQVMLAVAGFVIVLVLYFIISSSVIRRRRELGIQKAIGYTTFNLMNQISIGFLFPLIIGITVGCILGIISTNPIMSITMSGMGVMKANFIIEPAWVTVTGISMAVLSYAASMLITWRIRKISAYALVTE